jgi:hypothetical protein
MEISSTTNGTGPRPAGRPRTAANTALIQAMIDKQDALARRTRRHIVRFHHEHLDVQAVSVAWLAIARRARAAIGTLPGRAAAVIPELAADPGRYAALVALVETVLAELGPDDGSPLPPLPADDPVPTVRRSHSLPQARAQALRLATQWIDLQEQRLAPSADWTRSRDGGRP